MSSKEAQNCCRGMYYWWLPSQQHLAYMASYLCCYSCRTNWNCSRSWNFYAQASFQCQRQYRYNAHRKSIGRRDAVAERLAWADQSSTPLRPPEQIVSLGYRLAHAVDTEDLPNHLHCEYPCLLDICQCARYRILKFGWLRWFWSQSISSISSYLQTSSDSFTILQVLSYDLVIF